MTTALITGSSGFIGSHLIQNLPSIGIIPEALPRHYLKSDSIKTFLQHKDYNYIFHLAAYGNHYNQTDEGETLETNIAGTYNLLEATKLMKYKAFINFSSSSVLLPTRTFYSASKAATEHITSAFAQKYNKPAFSVRPSSVYGEGEADFHFIPQVIHNLLLGTPMEVDLKPKHDWIFIDDFIAVLVGLIEEADKIGGAPVNISTGKQHTNQAIIEVLEELTSKKLQLKKVKRLRPYDTTDWKVDNQFIHDMGWRPRYDLKVGLARTFEWFYEKYTAEAANL